jgi:hypothetical protein
MEVLLVERWRTRPRKVDESVELEWRWRVCDVVVAAGGGCSVVVVSMGWSGERRRLRPRWISGSWVVVVVSGEGVERVLVGFEVGGVALLDRVEMGMPSPGRVE